MACVVCIDMLGSIERKERVSYSKAERPIALAKTAIMEHQQEWYSIGWYRANLACETGVQLSLAQAVNSTSPTSLACWRRQTPAQQRRPQPGRGHSIHVQSFTIPPDSSVNDPI